LAPLPLRLTPGWCRRRYRRAVEIRRYRCNACGNLTRFDVTVTRTTRAFYHYSVGGDLRVDHEDVTSEVVESVECRWCGHGREVELVDGEHGAGRVVGTGNVPPA
jgi:ribosomal protein L37E